MIQHEPSRSQKIKKEKKKRKECWRVKARERGSMRIGIGMRLDQKGARRERGKGEG